MTGKEIVAALRTTESCSKRELLNDYYMDEIGPVFEEWNRLHDPNREETEEVDPMTFLGGEGEML